MLDGLRADTVLAGAGGSQIYDVQAITEEIRDRALEEGLREDDMEAALAFFTSEAAAADH